MKSKRGRSAPYSRLSVMWLKMHPECHVWCYLGDKSWQRRSKLLNLTAMARPTNEYASQFRPFPIVVPQGEDPRDFKYPVRGRHVVVYDGSLRMDEHGEMAVWAMLRDGATSVRLCCANWGTTLGTYER